MFSDKFNGANLYKFPKWLSAQDLKFFTDSAGGAHLGCATFFLKLTGLFNMASCMV